MFAVNIVRAVGWIIIVLVGIPSAVALLFVLSSLRDPSDVGVGFTMILAIVAVFLFSAANGALLVAFAQVVETLKASEESLRSIETNARRTSSKLEHLVKAVDPGAANIDGSHNAEDAWRSKPADRADPGFGARRLPSDHPVRRRLEEDD